MSSFVQPYVRKYNYIEDYFHTLYELYAGQYTAAYPVSYYSLDTTNSVMDDTVLNAGSYERRGIGELSGIKFRKIESLPIYGLTQVQPNQESNERGGLTYNSNMQTQIVFPSIYGLKPLENDVVDLSFGFRDPDLKNNYLYGIDGVNIAHESNYYQIWQCKLSPLGCNRSQLDHQISTYHMFYEPTQTIIPYNNAKYLLRIQDMANNVLPYINTAYNKQSGLYLV